jgi:hypothetical protein
MKERNDFHSGMTNTVANGIGADTRRQLKTVRQQNDAAVVANQIARDDDGYNEYHLIFENGVKRWVNDSGQVRP